MSTKLINPRPFIGRKKTSVAKCNFYQDDTFTLVVNGQRPDDYLMDLVHRHLFPILTPEYQVKLWCKGGGVISGHLACLKAIAVGLSKMHPAMKPVLKKNPYLWFDDRQVERKKFGRRKARRGQQWVKR